MLRALYLEWGNPDCCVPVPRALTGVASFDPSKTIRKEVIKRMKNMWMDIGKKKCVVCVMDNVLLQGRFHDSM